MINKLAKLKAPQKIARSKRNVGSPIQDDGSCRRKNSLSGIVTISISIALQTGEMVWAKVHTDSPVGEAFVLLSLKRKMRKREHQRLVNLLSRGKK